MDIVIFRRQTKTETGVGNREFGVAAVDIAAGEAGEIAEIFLAGAAEIVFCHQEHYDGSGYPSGLQGREIPIGARIFAVADTLDAITSDRPYRKARSFDAAREEILRCSGTQFDPAVVEAFLKIPNELWQELRSEISGQSKRFSNFDTAQPINDEEMQ